MVRISDVWRKEGRRETPRKEAARKILRDALSSPRGNTRQGWLVTLVAFNASAASVKFHE